MFTHEASIYRKLHLKKKQLLSFFLPTLLSRTAFQTDSTFPVELTLLTFLCNAKKKYYFDFIDLYRIIDTNRNRKKQNIGRLLLYKK